MGEFGDNGVRSGSLSAPLTVTSTFLEPARSRCSHSHTPCQVPKFSLPSDTGTVRFEPKKQALTWAGWKQIITRLQVRRVAIKILVGKALTMSSGPSQECLKGTSSGTILFSIISISSLTSGSQFSLMAKLAEVCRS